MSWNHALCIENPDGEMSPGQRMIWGLETRERGLFACSTKVVIVGWECCETRDGKYESTDRQLGG